jgi:hypothetical protein
MDHMFPLGMPVSISQITLLPTVELTIHRQLGIFHDRYTKTPFTYAATAKLKKQCTLTKTTGPPDMQDKCLQLLLANIQHQERVGEQALNEGLATADRATESLRFVNVDQEKALLDAI